MPRQPYFVVAVGRKGVGKTYTTKKIIKEYAIKQKRKVLILDINNEKEYSKIKTIPINYVFNKNEKDYIKIFSSKNYKVDIRRIIPYHPYDNRNLTTDEVNLVLSHILKTFYGGILVIEDIAKYVSDNMKTDIIGSLATIRHRNCDVITHFQWKKKIFNPKLYGNIDYIRVHKTNDNFSDYLSQIKGEKELFLLTDILVNYKNKLLKEKYLINNDIKKFTNKPIETYYCYIDLGRGKIFGKYSKSDISNVVDIYISNNYKKIIKPMLEIIDIKTNKKKYTPEKAINEVKNNLINEYFVF